DYYCQSADSSGNDCLF
nr:immunoglobulin light chain junction region [Macaca mulatta]